MKTYVFQEFIKFDKRFNADNNPPYGENSALTVSEQKEFFKRYLEF